MNHKATLANQLRRLESKLTLLHDSLNDRYGPANELTQLSMHCFALVFACSTDLEYIMDEGHSDEE